MFVDLVSSVGLKPISKTNLFWLVQEFKPYTCGIYFLLLINIFGPVG
jgi:hypothetical protein